MKKIALLILLIISCPQPGIKEVTPPDYLHEALRTYQYRPQYAYSMLRDSAISTKYKNERGFILSKLFLEQREFAKAAAILDSIDWQCPLSKYEKSLVLYRNRRWQELAEYTSDSLLEGICYYYLEDYANALRLFKQPYPPHDYRILYIMLTYQQLKDFNQAFQAYVSLDSISSYLKPEFQRVLLQLFADLSDTTVINQELMKIEEKSLREYVLLKVYERQGTKKQMEQTAWNLITKYPKSEGAYYAVTLVKPGTKSQHKACGKVYYFHNDYNESLKHLQRSSADNAVNYYIGKIHYYKKNYSNALTFLARSNWSAAYYYRGRIYEKNSNFRRALSVYDSLYKNFKHTKYGQRGFKRKAFLLEDIGDTLQAIKTFLTIDEKNTKFRAALHLYRLGNLAKAEKILSAGNTPEFLYWRIRIREKMGKPVGDLKKTLRKSYPFSYYNIVQGGQGLPFDTTSMKTWLAKLGDTSVSFSPQDSAHILRAHRYFVLNEMSYATEELELIDNKSAQDYYYLSKLCALYMADKHSILYALKVKKFAKTKGTRTLPYELFRLIYPIRYMFTIQAQNIDPSLCLAMIWQESLFDPGARSWANARGIMQIIPPTAEQIARDLEVPEYSLYDPGTSIKFGCYYYLNLYKDLKSIPLSLAGYNAGPVRVKRWIKQDPNYKIDEFIDLIPFNETRNYVKSILMRRVIYQTLLNI